jgi:hypothetical protein
MSLIKLISELDSQIAAEQNLEDKKKLQLNMFLIEIKYNLDLLDSIKLDKDLPESHDNQLRQVINLLSSDALSNLLKYGGFQSESVFMSSIYQFLKSITKLTSTDIDEIISQQDTLIFNIYKRIEVIKALSSIEPPYTSIKQLNLRTRLRNLKDVLLEINSKIHI